MRRLLLACLIPLLLALPGAALAAESVTLAEHLARLEQIAAHVQRAKDTAPGPTAVAELNAAQALARGEWDVATPSGPVHADLGPLRSLLVEVNPGTVEGRRALSEAAEVVNTYVAGARALQIGAAQPLPADARDRLSQALREAEINRKWYDRFLDWFGTILGRWFGNRTGDGGQPITTRPWFWWVGGGVGLIGLVLLSRALIRTLTGHAPGEEAALRARKALADRPLTPADLRERGRSLAREGAHLEALRTVHLALLKFYDERGLIRYHPAHTNREHERQVRSRFPGIARSLRTLHDLVEDRLYSGHGATHDDFAAADGLVEQLWREGDAASRSAEATSGRSSSAQSR